MRPVDPSGPCMSRQNSENQRVSSVCGAEPELAAAHAFRVDAQVAAADDGAVIGMDVVHQKTRLLQKLLGPEPRDLLHGARDVGDLSVLVPLCREGDDRQGLQDDGEALGSLNQPCLSVFSRYGRAQGACHHGEGLHLHIGPFSSRRIHRIPETPPEVAAIDGHGGNGKDVLGSQDFSFAFAGFPDEAVEMAPFSHGIDRSHKAFPLQRKVLHRRVIDLRLIPSATHS